MDENCAIVMIEITKFAKVPVLSFLPYFLLRMRAK